MKLKNESDMFISEFSDSLSGKGIHPLALQGDCSGIRLIEGSQNMQKRAFPRT